MLCDVNRRTREFACFQFIYLNFIFFFFGGCGGGAGCGRREQAGRAPAACAPVRAAGESRPPRRRAVRFDTAVRSHFDQC